MASWEVLRRLFCLPLVVGGSLLNVSCSRLGSRATGVISDDTPVYAQMSAAGPVTAILQKGHVVKPKSATLSGTSECWVSIAWGTLSLHSRFVRCEDIEHPPPVAPPASSPQKDQIDQLLALAGIDRYAQAISQGNSLRFLLNTQRIDENDEQIRQVLRQALRSAGFYQSIRAGFVLYSSDKRIPWLMDQLNQPLIRRATGLGAQANAVEWKRDLVPYLAGVLTTRASPLRGQFVERIEKALNQPEALVEVTVAMTRGASKATARYLDDQPLDSREFEPFLDAIRASAMKETAKVVRIVNLYSYAPLRDEELEQYVRFVESENVRWMNKVVQEGVLKGSETFATESFSGLMRFYEGMSPLLQNPTGGRTAQGLYAQGVRLLDSGKEREAIRLLDEALGLKPDYALAYYKRGNAFRNLDQTSKAIDDYTHAIRYDPSMTLAYLNRGIGYKALGQPQRALEEFSLGIQSNPEVAAVWIERAVTHGMLEQHLQAVADFTQAIRITAADGEAWAWRGMAHGHLQEWQRALQDCQIGIRLGTRPSELAPVYTCTGRALAGVKDFGRAITELDHAVKLDQKSAITYQNRGWVLEELGRIEDALQDYEEAIKLDPHDAWTHCKRAKILARLGRSAEGQADLAYCSADQK